MAEGDFPESSMESVNQDANQGEIPPDLATERALSGWAQIEEWAGTLRPVVG